MKIRILAVLGFAALCVLVASQVNLAQQQAKPPSPASAAKTASSAAPMTLEAQNALIAKYCAGCHNDKAKSGNMSLSQFDTAHPENAPELAEKIIRKTRVGLMPKSGSPRPDRPTLRAFAESLENAMDKAAALHPNPGSRPFQRLTRDEYANSIRDLLGIEVDVAKFLPPDSLSDGLDNIADSQAFSAALMEGYIRAADRISREALGDAKAEPASEVYKIPRTASQLHHVEGTPFGTRGGFSTIYNFPADGEYNFRSLLHSTSTGQLFGNLPNEQLEISIDGQRVALLTVELTLSEGLPTGMNLYSGRVAVKAGPHRMAAAFIAKHSEVVEDDIAEIEHSLFNTDIGTDKELTIYPHLREFEITGPYTVSGISETPARQRIFICRPLNAGEELPCATKIISELGRKAYRRPISPDDMEGLMTFYEKGRKKGGNFEAGIRSSLQAMLASLDFVFKFEKTPTAVKPGQTYRIGDLELASRLSYFLWNTLPDDQLIQIASQGKLKDPIMLEKQVRRMLADPRSETLSTKFASEWLHLQDIYNLNPEGYYYPQYDYTLAQGLKRETELLFDSVVREDRNVVDLLTADYTFVNDRVAQHYGIPNISGSQFRRVPVPADYRRGLLGKGSVLALTSVADRTSPVLRGKWVMGVLLGTPPPPPPPAVPKLEETAAIAGGKTLTIRERMEAHRANPACNSCHSMIDPIGLSLENFDLTGKWRNYDTTYAINDEGARIHTKGVPIDTKSKLYDGTPLDGPASLRQAMVNHSDAFIQNLTEKLTAYAIGRRIEYYDMPTIRAITHEAAKNNNRFSSMVLGIVKSPAFQMSKAEAAPTDAAR
jgi:hypothetical protein